MLLIADKTKKQSYLIHAVGLGLLLLVKYIKLGSSWFLDISDPMPTRTLLYQYQVRHVLQ